MTNFYIIAQYPYETIELALCEQGNIIKSINIHKHLAVSDIIPSIQTLLGDIPLKNIQTIGINAGPGPYNTLRALITTVNGIKFVQNRPIISAFALDLMIQEQPAEQNTLVVLNAFAKHVFYKFNSELNKEQGYCSIQELLEKIKKQEECFIAIGNGTLLYKDLLETVNEIIIPDNMPLFNKLETLALYTHEQYRQNNFLQDYAAPIYLHSPAIK